MVYFLCFIILVLLLRYKMKKASSSERTSYDSFWEREQKAQFTRKKDISNLETIQIDFGALPFVDTEDVKLKEIQNKVRSFENKKMVNLSHIDNTDIKMEYGIANFPLISQYDQNYLVFSRYLYEWGKYLYDASQYDEARYLLELALSHGTDISGIYITLAQIYKSNHELDKISDLIAAAKDLTTLMKPKILNELKSILNS